MRRLLAALTLSLTLLCPVALPVASQNATQTQQDPKAQTVYVTRTGKKYHRDGCRYLAMNKSAISLEDAKAKQYTALVDKLGVSAIELSEIHGEPDPGLQPSFTSTN